MAKTLLAEIVTPERILYTNEVLMVVATTPAGEVGVLPMHMPMVTELAPGEVRLQTGESAADWEFFSVSGGYLQVHEDKVIVLADAAVSVSQIDKARVLESIDLIKERLAELPVESDERSDVERDLHWQELQVRAAERRA